MKATALVVIGFAAFLSVFVVALANTSAPLAP